MLNVPDVTVRMVPELAPLTTTVSASYAVTVAVLLLLEALTVLVYRETYPWPM